VEEIGDLHLNSVSVDEPWRICLSEVLNSSNFGTVVTTRDQMLIHLFPVISIPFENGSSNGLDVIVAYREKGFELVTFIKSDTSTRENCEFMDDRSPAGGIGISSVGGAVVGAITPFDVMNPEGAMFKD
jgi:hypothetical protein